MHIRTAHKKLIQSLIAEMTCSLIFGYTVYSAIMNTKFTKSPIEAISVNLAVCFSSIALIYTFCDLSLSHFNPAITLAAVLTRRLDPLNGIAFIIAQLIGFILAGLLLVATFPGSYMEILDQVHVDSTTKAVTNVNLFFSEFTMTAILVFVAFSVSINARRDPNKSLYQDEELPNRTIVAPLTIGLTLGYLSFIGAKTSGSCFNPGIVFGPMMLTMDWSYSWQYYVSQFTGGLLGALIQVYILFK